MTVNGQRETRQSGGSRSSRDYGRLRAELERWLAGQLPGDASPAITEFSEPPSVGQSSETLIFEAEWQDGGTSQTRKLVARVAPQPVDLPLFPSYNLTREYQVMQAVRELTDAPVPESMWLETDPSHLGSPFFIMSHVDGKVPTDVVYMLDSWLAKGTEAEVKTAQDSTVDAVASVHAAAGPLSRFAFLQFPEAGDTPLRRHVAHAWKWYEYAQATCGVRFPLIEQGFGWLADHWPSQESDPVLLWGDSRIGNVLYRDFRPAALLDWEMSAVGPRELDIAWLVASHRVFVDMLAEHGVPGMPDFLRLDDVAARYESVTGRAVRDMEFYLTYAAVQWGIVSAVAQLRRVRFGLLPEPDDYQALVINRSTLSRLLAGGPWWE
jgi:aminoglycoside phosphotransferase (APT) family kinase protein